MKVNYQEYCADNLIRYDFPSKEVELKIRKLVKDYKPLDLRSHHSSILIQGSWLEFYYTVIKQEDELVTSTYLSRNDETMYKVSSDNIEVTGCFNSRLAKSLWYVLRAKRDKVVLASVKKEILKFS